MIRIFSARERWLWRCALAILGAILASAVFAGSLVSFLRSEAVLGIAFAAGFALAVVTVLGLALRPSQRTDPWIALAAVGAISMIPVRSGVTAIERTHLFEYGLLAVVLYEALVERRNHGGHAPPPWLAAICAASMFGWLDEAVQAFVPNRIYDLRDVAINALAAFGAVVVVAVIRWGRARRTGPAEGSGAAATGHAQPPSRPQP